MLPELSPRVADNICRFVGREWLLPHILMWFEDSTDRFFLLTGEPGSGKSMVAAWLGGAGPEPLEATAQEQLRLLRTQVKAVHFCRSDSGSVAPKALAENIADQLTRNVNGFAEALSATLASQVQIVAEVRTGSVASGASVTGVAIGKLDLGGLSDELSFDRTLREPLRRLYREGYGKPLLLLIDGLDEALTYTGSIQIQQLLAKVTDLPQVRFLLTTRPDPRILKYFRQFPSFDLTNDVPDAARRDIEEYVRKWLVGRGESTRSNLTARIGEMAKGQFLYADLVLRSLPEPIPNDWDVPSVVLPSDLSGIYHDFLNRELGRDEERWFKLFRPVLGLSAVAQGDGLTAAAMTEILDTDVEPTVRICKQYLDGNLPAGPFRTFHKSFSDFLLEDSENKDYHIDSSAMHNRIVDFYLKKVNRGGEPDWSQLDEYGLQHIAVHLVKAQRGNDLIRIARDERFLDQQKSRFSDHPLASLDSLRLALREAMQKEDAAMIVEFSLKHARRWLQITGESPIAAVRANLLERAWKLADSYEMELRILWYLLIAWELKEGGKKEQALSTIERLCALSPPEFTTILTNPAAQVLSCLYEVSPQSFTYLQQRLFSENCRERLCGYLLDRQLYSVAVDTAQTLENVSRQAEVLRRIGEGVVRNDAGKAVEILDDALQVAVSTGAQEVEVKALASLALAHAKRGTAHLAGEKIACAINNLRECTFSSPQSEVEARILIAAAQVLVDEEGETKQRFAGIRDLIAGIWNEAETLASMAVAYVRANQEEYAQPVFSEALTMALNHPWETSRVGLLAAIASAQSSVGMLAIAKDTLSQAYMLIDTVDSSWRSPDLLNIADAESKIGNSTAAREIIVRALILWDRRSEEQSMEAEVLACIAKTLAKRGDAEQAQSVFAHSLKKAEDVNANYNNLLEFIAKAQADAGLFADAIATAHQIGWEAARATTLRAISAMEARHGNILSAYEIARNIIPGYHRAMALCDVAQTQVKSGRIEEGREAFHEALSIFSEDESDPYRATNMSIIAIYQAQVELFSDAKKTFRKAVDKAKRIKNKLERELELVGIGGSLNVAGCYDREIRLARERNDNEDASKALACRALRHHAGGRADRARTDLIMALKSAKLADSRRGKVEALLRIAVTQAHSKDTSGSRKTFRLALRIAAEIGNENRSPGIHAEIAVAQVEAGDFDAAVATADELTNIGDQEHALGLIAWEMAKKGLYPEAVNLVNRIPIYRDQFARLIGTILAEENRKEDFKELLLESLHSLETTFALCQLIPTLYPEQASNLVPLLS